MTSSTPACSSASDAGAPCTLAKQIRKIICAETARAADALRGCKLRAVVLTGSIARDEGTLVEVDGTVRLLGDADFFFIYSDGASLPSSMDTRHLEESVEAILKRQCVTAHVSFSVVHTDYLQSLRPSIAAYELRTNGRVIWGDPNVLSLMSDFSSSEIPREDAWRLLANRLIEMLDACVFAKDHDLQAPTDELLYALVKLYLDMTTSYLVFSGEYRPTYAGRAAAIRVASQRANTDMPVAHSTFADRIQACTEFKLGHRLSPDLPSASFVEALEFAQQLWSWELGRLLGAGITATPDKLMSAWMTTQSFQDKVRGWASLIRRTPWSIFGSNCARWCRMASRGSPRYWTYSAVAELICRIPGMVKGMGRTIPADANWSVVTRQLPVADSTCSAELTWRSVAAMAVQNYDRFLKTTLA